MRFAKGGRVVLNMQQKRYCLQLRARLLALIVLAILGSYAFALPMATVEATTAALPGASVDAQGPSSGSNSTDSSGNYNIAGIYTAGGYNVSASADGFLKAYYPILATVTLGHETAGVNLNLARSSIVTGQVTGPDGSPVAGATVKLVVNDSSTEVGSDTTTSDGLYAIETDVPSGLYQA